MIAADQSIAVLGSMGRIGRQVVPLLTSLGYQVHTVEIERNNSAQVLPSDRTALAPHRNILNLAGRAHLDKNKTTPSDLWASNVHLVSRVCSAASETGSRVLHLSSTKAITARTSAYGLSKAVAEAEMQRIAVEWLSLDAVAIRAPAILVPPYEAGRLRLLAKAPAPFPPFSRMRVPAISLTNLLNVILQQIERPRELGFKIVEFARRDHVLLGDAIRSVRSASKK